MYGTNTHSRKSRNVSRRHQGKAKYHAQNVLGLLVIGTKMVTVAGGQKQERSGEHEQKTGEQA